MYLVGFVLLYLGQERFIFLDDDLPQDYQFSSSIAFDEMTLEGQDGGRLNALHFKADSTKGVILYFHGNRGNLTRWGDIVSPMTQYGYDVFVMDYRGFGKSTGRRNQANLLADADLFYTWCKDRYEEKNIILFGRSLGTGLASYLASKNEPKQLILETPYYSLARAAQRFYPIYPSKLALRYNFESNKYLTSAKCPISIFHGTEDTVVPYEQGVELAESLATGRVNFITIEGGEHRNLSDFELYHYELEKLLNQ